MLYVITIDGRLLRRLQPCGVPNDTSMTWTKRHITITDSTRGRSCVGGLGLVRLRR